MVGALLDALAIVFAMGWKVLRALILGLALRGLIEAVATKGEIGRLLPDSSTRLILMASGLGCASAP